jgi:hypothetical protein
LFDALGDLYDGHAAEGAYNFNSTQPPQHEVLKQVENLGELSRADVSCVNLDDTMAYTTQEDGDVGSASVHLIEDDDENVTRDEQRMSLLVLQH